MEDAAEKPRPGWLRRHWKLVVAVWLGLSLAGKQNRIEIVLRCLPSSILTVSA